MNDHLPLGRTLLTAEWLDLIMLNYEVDPLALAEFVPQGTELDFFEQRCLASIVGFRFDNTRLWGRVPIFCGRNFPEINLRFYVKRRVGRHWRRGVVFIKELAPKRLVCRVARWLFYENYHYTPLRVIPPAATEMPDGRRQLRYEWPQPSRTARLSATTRGPLRALVAGSVEEFIAEHYWAYSRREDGRTLEYHVVHPTWKYWPVDDCHFDAEIERLYGQQLATQLRTPPDSAFLAQGSRVSLELGSMLAEQ